MVGGLKDPMPYTSNVVTKTRSENSCSLEVWCLSVKASKFSGYLATAATGVTCL